MPTFSISGSLGAGGVGASVSYYSNVVDGFVTADGSGNYTIPGLANGSYHVSPTVSGYTFSPTVRTVSVSNADVTNSNYTANAFVPPGWSYSQIAQTTFQQADGPLDLTDWSLMLVTPSPNAQVLSHICESSSVGSGSWLLWSGGTGWQSGAQYAEVAIHNLVGNISSNVITLALLANIDPITVPTGFSANINPDATGQTLKIQAGANNNGNVGTRVIVPFVPDAKYRMEFFNGTLIQYYNGNVIQATTGLSAHNGDTGNPGLVIEVADALENSQVSGFAGGNVGYSISGNAGIAGATVYYSGTASGSVTADGSGNYSITGMTNGGYTITPSKTGYTFSPTSASETVSGADITGVNFTATQLQVATPTFSPVAGTYSSSQSVTVSSTDSGLSGFVMYYTTDGSTPTTSSTLYSGAITVSASETLKVLAVATGYLDSAIASAVYVIGGSSGDGFSSNFRFRL
jgi:hypothetical protein